LAKGRGLDALLGSIQKEKLQLEAQALIMVNSNKLMSILKRGEYQPRRFIQNKIYKSLQHQLKNMV
jgi:ParB family chromosome partitioning protein